MSETGRILIEKLTLVAVNAPQQSPVEQQPDGMDQVSTLVVVGDVEP